MLPHGENRGQKRDRQTPGRDKAELGPTNRENTNPGKQTSGVRLSGESHLNAFIKAGFRVGMLWLAGSKSIGAEMEGGGKKRDTGGT